MNKINRLILISLLTCCWGKTFSQTTDSLSVFPNPFNSSATIHFSIAQIDTITLKVFNVVGETVRTFFQSTILPSGTYNINLLGDGLADGIYFVRLNIGSTNTLTEKVVKSGLTNSVAEDKSAKNRIVVFPNPTTDYLTIPIDGIKTIIVTDLSGRILKSITTHQQTISLLDLSTGQYFITISTKYSGIITTQKIVKSE
jgi:hypothetical protein